MARRTNERLMYEVNSPSLGRFEEVSLEFKVSTIKTLVHHYIVKVTNDVWQTDLSLPTSILS